MSTVALHLSVPVAGFRVAQARELFETYPVPPPSTVYGMLLSAVGEEDRLRHEGAEIALALTSRPRTSAVLRTTWRVKEKKVAPGNLPNRRPDYQELLSPVVLAVWVRPGEREARPTLAERIAGAVDDPSTLSRYGGLSLGESTHIVDELRRRRDGDPEQGALLVSNDQGSLSLPIWPNHVGSKGTHWGQFELEERVLGEIPNAAWSVIERPREA